MIRIYCGKDDFLRERKRASHQRDRVIRDRVERILDRVREDGDRALIELAQELDGAEVASLRVTAAEIEASATRASAEMRDVLRRAADNIQAFHEPQKDAGFRQTLDDGSVLAQHVRPLTRVGIYVPGGAGGYPSTVLMNAIPARIAGVRDIVMCTPPGAIERSPELAAAIVDLAIDEVYRIGGAQAIAAMAFGTESVSPVDKIVGPGNRYVAEAKRLVFGTVGIDAIAGPSEIVVLADESASVRYVAADLLSQAEHGSGDESAILVTTSLELAKATLSELDRQLALLPRAPAIREVLEKHGAAVVVASLEDALELVDAIAPEHLEVLTRDAEEVGQKVQNAGAIFVGAHAPVPVGDFYAGPNHVLPTGGTARFGSPLGVHDFYKRSSWMQYSAERLSRQRRDIEAFARAEGFEAHARAIAIRFET